MNPVFRITKTKPGKRTFTFEIDVTKDMKDVNFICECKARVRSTKRKGLLEILELPVRLLEEDHE